jgi:hypothetical protein
MAKTKEEEKREADAFDEIMKEKEAKDAAKAAEARKKEAEESGGKDSVSVFSKTGNFVRTYSPFQSGGGKSHIEKAEGYAAKIGGTVKKA